VPPKTEPPSRRSFLASALGFSAAAFLCPVERLVAAIKGRVKITDIKTMLLQGPRTYTLVKVETDAGVYGVAEAYGSPGLGIVEAIHGVKEFFIGQDPLQIDRLYTVYRYTDGSAHHQQRAYSGIEMALWDLAGKLLEVPTSTLLGGRFRDRVRMYDHAKPSNFLDKIACRDWADEVMENPNGMASVQWASSIRDYLACETVWFQGDWMDDVIVHDAPLCQDGYVELSEKPGLGIELDPDVVKAHLVEGERWWD